MGKGRGSLTGREEEEKRKKNETRKGGAAEEVVAVVQDASSLVQWPAWLSCFLLDVSFFSSLCLFGCSALVN